ncbi:hypothetical protein NHQ30_004304 [Ciborinia camelliae]|nr:hypothetical protein NHQ30_004304 [Ciborinia camelliae]
MELMGVRIEPQNFHADDRLGTTIALASQIISRGGSADWLGMPAKIPPCPQLPTFPQFAQTEVAGHARFRRAGSLCPGRSMDDWVFARPSWDYQDRKLWHWERIRGWMDEDGYLHFRRRACAATLVTAVVPSDITFEWHFLKDTDGQVWRLQPDLDLDIPGKKSRIAVIPL